MRIVFALPGPSFSREFLINWSRILSYCTSKGHEVIISAHFSSMVHFARAKCFGYDVTRGADQKPFGGDVEYDVIVCIDSDVLASPEDVQKLLDSPHDVTAGLYMMADNTHFATVKEWDLEHFKKNGSFQFLTPAAVQDLSAEQYVPVAYSGLGFTAFKRGALEKVSYPPFWRPLEVIEVGDGKPAMVDMTSEDVSLAKNLADKGVVTYIRTDLRVGHQKLMVL